MFLECLASSAYEGEPVHFVLRKGGSLSVPQAEPSSLSLGMFGKCEWRSVPQAGRCRLDELRSARARACAHARRVPVRSAGRPPRP